MGLAITIALWLLFSGFLVFPHLQVPRMLTTATALLLALEFIAAVVWGFAHGTPLGDTAGTAATIDFPALGVLVLGLVIARGLRPRKRERPAHASLSRCPRQESNLEPSD